MRQLIVAGNWKMNTTLAEGTALAEAVKANAPNTEVKIILGTPYIHLDSVATIIEGENQIFLAAQNCHAAPKGAYTGEISVAMLKSVGTSYVILGHSERRKYFGETDASVAEKVKVVLEAGMLPIVCVGEELSVREAGSHESLVQTQIATGLFDLGAEDFGKVVIAYEPVWAIGTGVTASPEQAQEMHAFIRKIVREQYGETVADDLSILYGGSVKPHNAKDLFGQTDVDGGLIGGASLKAGDFIAIANSF